MKLFVLEYRQPHSGKPKQNHYCDLLTIEIFKNFEFWIVLNLKPEKYQYLDINRLCMRPNFGIGTLERIKIDKNQCSHYR